MAPVRATDTEGVVSLELEMCGVTGVCRTISGAETAELKGRTWRLR